MTTWTEARTVAVISPDAIRFSTLIRLCDVRVCQPGDLFSYDPPEHSPTT
ncbi:helix-turn-helix domain-containing protein [Streptosporangium lutulentum]|uniref:DNA-binding Xre family transcriptional regulator n=1 Tax=Streptosporangium lutulentum TaxID=1461250 RepID=A0ABT9QA22_9ACTN|nr:helix-turn-helix domain-containing protein [Streptosporangium lutulentum]MDP9843608.1 DNA-binding Xre family transcriptional regulator [Streptosporangium lutulentum]